MNCVIKTPDGKTQVHSINKSTVSIGRSKSCDIPIFSDSLSRIHCQIFEENGEFFIMDLNSTNGVFINDERIDPNKKIRLISFLNVKIAFLYELTIVPEHQIHEEKKELLSFVETTKTKNSFSRVTKPKADSSKRRETQLDGKKNIFLSLIVIFGGVLFINYRSSENYPEEVSYTEETLIPQTSETLSFKKNESSETKKIASYDLIFQAPISEENFKTKIKCSDELLEDFCRQKGALDKFEGYFIFEGVLYGYFSFENEKKRYSSFQWSGDKDDEEKMLVLNLFNDSIFQKHEEIQVTKFKLVIFDSTVPEQKNLIAAVIDYKNAKSFGTDAYYSSVSKIMEGDFSQMKPLLEELKIHKF